MAGDIAKLLASLDLDTRPFSKGAGRVSGDLSKMEGGFGRVSTRAIAFGAAVGVGIERLAEKGISVLFDSLRAGEEGLHTLQNAQAQTQAVIESTGGAAHVTAQQVRDLAESIESLTTADDKSVQNAENLLLTFTNISGTVFPAATKAVVDLGIALNGGSAVGVDFSKTAIQVGKALNDPVKGLTALRKVGVSFTADQQKQIKALVKAGDVMGAQKVILAELTKEFGKAGEAAGKSGAAGVVRLSDAVEDAQIALATGLAPALEEIRGEIAKGLSDPGTQQDLRNLGQFLGEAAKSGLAFAKSVPWRQIGEGLKTAAGFAGDLIKVFANLPPQVQATIIGLAALNKLGGGGVIKIGVDLFKEGAGKLFGAFVSRGSPANPMFVVAEGAGIGGGAPGGVVAGAAKGGLGLASKLFLVGEAIGLIAAVNEVRDGISQQSTKQAQDIHQSLSTSLASPQTVADLTQKLSGIDQGIAALKSNPLNVLVQGDALTELEKMRAEVQAAFAARPEALPGNPNQREDRGLTGNQKKAQYEAYKARVAAEKAITLAAAQKAALDRIRERAESNAITTKDAIGDVRDESVRAKIAAAGNAQTIRNATTTGSSQIVTAIERNRPITNLTVNVDRFGNVKTDQTYSNGDMGGGSSGGGKRRR